MPPRSRAPRTRVSGIRRPRVAGLAPGAPRSETAEDRYGAVALDEAVRPAEPTEKPPAERVVLTKSRVPAPVEEAEELPADPRRPARRRTVALLVIAVVVLTGAAVFFAVDGARLHGTPAARNTALVDREATTAVIAQLSAAVKTAYSYDHARLDENERDARAGMTPAMADQFTKLFAQVRQFAPQQKAVVTATIAVAGVQSIEGDRAQMVVFVDQLATRVGADGKPAQFSAPGRLTVTGKLIDERWLLDGMEAR